MPSGCRCSTRCCSRRRCCCRTARRCGSRRSWAPRAGRPPPGRDPLAPGRRRRATRHCAGWLAPDTEPAVGLAGAWPPAGAEPVPVDGLYTALADLGLDCGPALHGVRAAWRSGREVYAELALHDGVGTAEFGIHPALFESALHLGQLGFAEQDAPKLPVSWSGVRLAATGAAHGRARVTSDGDTLRLELFAEDGALVLGVDRVAFHEVDPAHLEELRRDQNALYRVDWTRPRSGGRTGAAGRARRATAEVTDRYADVADLERAVAAGAVAPQLAIAAVDTPPGTIRRRCAPRLTRPRTWYGTGRTRSGPAGPCWPW
ncbi:polyketide synthase dehydratase domain-containing protein [Streptomyces sp. M19]